MIAALGMVAIALALWPARSRRSSAAHRLASTIGDSAVESPAAEPDRDAAAIRPALSGGGGRQGLPLLVAIAGGLITVALIGLSPVGVAAAVIASILCNVMVRRSVAASARRRESLDAADVPLFLDVLATQLRSGAPIAAALRRATPLAPAAVRPLLLETSALLMLGAPASDAWRSAEGTVLQDLAALARRSADNGAQLADQTVRLAVDLRARRVTAIESAARRAGVWAMAPLGLCFLPAFVCLGVAPVVLGLVGSALGGAGPGGAQLGGAP